MEKLNHVGDAQTILDEIASSKIDSHMIYGSDSKEATLNMYKMEAKLLAKAKRYPQAIKLPCKESNWPESTECISICWNCGQPLAASL